MKIADFDRLKTEDWFPMLVFVSLAIAILTVLSLILIAPRTRTRLRPRTTDQGPSPTSNSPIKLLGPRTESDITGKFSVCDFSPRTESDIKRTLSNAQTTDRVRGPSPSLWSDAPSNSPLVFYFDTTPTY
ncbi:hypothetical protein LXL04_008413 [Taraxacum kok-saghyz]